MSASIVVAYDDLRVIGSNGMLPWKLSEDMRLFKERTLGHTCIMGRKTWESFALVKKPQGRRDMLMLPGRKNLVITSQADQLTDHFATLIGEHPLFFISASQARRIARMMKPDDCFVIGGETIYDHFLRFGLVETVYASEVPGQHEGDAFFPQLGEGWVAKSVRPEAGFKLVEYVKKVVEPQKEQDS